jgi:adenosylcobyric acid synthase
MAGRRVNHPGFLEQALAKALMFQGTGSDVGKSVLVAGLCRVAKRRGIRVLPFKPQNMSNNAAVAVGDGISGEIGRAQWLQALACGAEPSVHMNPVLLKPQSETGSQVVVQGKVFGTARGRDYQKLKPQLMAAVLESFARVCANADLVLVEGAGSPAEVNLRSGDIANMGFATRAGVPVVLVGDIDRGGVIASLVGTHAVLSLQDRNMVAGYIINKFRGDQSLFAEGISIIGRHTGWRSFGILPHLAAARRLPAEDSVALERGFASGNGRIRIAVPVLPHISNFDDFDPLLAEPDVDLVFVRSGDPIPADAALIILPGSKSTLADLAQLRANRWDRDIARHHARGGRIIGLCGGYQMLGRKVSDPLGMEGEAASVHGLGLLEIETVMQGEKVTRLSHALSADGNLPLDGYEIHLGRTVGDDCARPMVWIDGRADGAVSGDGLVSGCYLHGLFGSDPYRKALIENLGGIATSHSYRQDIENALDEIAARIEECLEVEALLATAARA